MTEDELVCHPDYCHGCHRIETIPPDVSPFMVCGECRHVYWTAEELVRRYRVEASVLAVRCGLDLAPSDVAGPAADEIAFCQECLHDF